MKNKRIVIKVGSSTLTYETGRMNIKRMDKLVSVLSDLANAGHDIALVSSGAVAVGMGKLALKERPRDIRGKQAVAAVGQCDLMAIYDKMFGQFARNVAQILLTRDVIERDIQRQNCINTFERLFEIGVIPIVNENDSVAVEEFGFGENDTLSAIVAGIVGADMLIILTDTKGLYDKDPRECADAHLIGHIEHIDDSLLEYCGGAGSNRGTGGMAAKVSAAKIACSHGVKTVIASGENPEIIYDILDGKAECTVFEPENR